MRRVLLTSFEPFGGHALNSSHEVARAVNERPPSEVELRWVVLPVVASRCARVAWEWVERLGPELVLALGQSAGAAALRLERRAVNLDDFPIPDNDGVRICKKRIAAGPPDYPATAAVDELAQVLEGRGIPVERSLSAGNYVCNRLYFELLHRAATAQTAHRTLFVHVPLLPGQVAEKHRAYTPSRPLEELAEGVRLVIAAAVDGTAIAPGKAVAVMRGPE
jgi:pyroglutamyl-peptidase